MRKDKTCFADCSYLIDLTRENKEALNIQKDNRIMTGLVGVYELGKLSNLTVEQIVSDNLVEPLSSEDIQKSVNKYRELRDKGEMINQLDILIAAQAINRNLTLLTAEEDFKKNRWLRNSILQGTIKNSSEILNYGNRKNRRLHLRD